VLPVGSGIIDSNVLAIRDGDSAGASSSRHSVHANRRGVNRLNIQHTFGRLAPNTRLSQMRTHYRRPKKSLATVPKISSYTKRFSFGVVRECKKATIALS
jgi:hypothetical protein